MPKVKDLSGLKFGKWTVIEKDGVVSKKSRWICRCECGTVKSADGDSLIRGKSKGCIKCRVSHKKHGMSHEKIYGVWHGILQRCENPNSQAYANYGGRGISVCKEWHEFILFYNWAESSGYKAGVEIDRINVNGNYEPLNCRWISHQEQQYNKRNNNVIEFHGKSQTLQQWANEMGIKPNTLYERIKLHGIEKSLSIKFVGRGNRIA